MITLLSAPKTKTFWAILGLTVLNVGAWFAADLLKTPPYRNVNVILAGVDDNQFNLVATFEKTACVFQRLTVIAYEGEVSERLNWRDVDDLGPSLDREIGHHTLRIVADLNGEIYDRIRIITRHDCDGRTVDRLFMEYAP